MHGNTHPDHQTIFCKDGHPSAVPPESKSAASKTTYYLFSWPIVWPTSNVFA